MRSVVATATVALAFSLSACETAEERRAAEAERSESAQETYRDELERQCDEHTASMKDPSNGAPENFAPKDHPCTALVEYDGYRIDAALFDYYAENIGYPADLARAEDELDVVLSEGNRIIGYEVVDSSSPFANYCVVHSSGAWAFFASGTSGMIGRGTTGETCAFPDTQVSP